MEDRVQKIIENIFSYSEFVNQMEIDNGSLDSWFNMEILNALALDEWESQGCPMDWNKWDKIYQEKAIKLVNCFFKEMEG